MTQSEFYSRLGITKSYFYEILSGNVNPPPSKLQFKIIHILKPDEKKQNYIFQVAAEERKEIPADITCYLEYNNDVINQIRKTEDFAHFLGGRINGS
jgi:transcriptional regulator with XRE-family HTH domain